jgi:hypothetical protein
MAVTYNTLINQLRYEDRVKERRDAQERAESNRNFYKFTTMATSTIKAATGLAGIANRETDIGKLEELSNRIEESKTGVDFVDNLMSVNQDSIELRKRAVTARNTINSELDILMGKLDGRETEGFKKAHDALRNQYILSADNMVAESKTYLDAKFKNASEKFEYNLYKNEFDTDKVKEGYQLPEHFTDLDKDYFKHELETDMNISEETGSYEGILTKLRAASTGMRSDRMTVDAASLTAEAKLNVAAGKQDTAIQTASNKRVLEGFKATLVSSRGVFGDLANLHKGVGGERQLLTLAKSKLPSDLTMTGTDPNTFNPDVLIDSIERSLLTLMEDDRAAKIRDRKTSGDTTLLGGSEYFDLPVDDATRKDMFDTLYNDTIKGKYTTLFGNPTFVKQRTTIMNLYDLRQKLFDFKKQGFPEFKDSADSESMKGYDDF